MSTPGQTPAQGISDAWNERMRMIRLRRKKEAFRFSEEFRIIPKWLKVSCLVLYLLALAIGVWGAVFFPDSRFPELRDNTAEAAWAVAGAVTGVSILFAAYILMLGYVNRDARRRGMNSALWTLLVLVLSPGYVGIGFIIYFLIREPLPYPCPRCGQLAGPRFNFCPNCKCDLHPSCPNCKKEIAETDKFCPYCATDLKVGQPAATIPAEHSA
jgi:hypothetical protein